MNEERYIVALEISSSKIIGTIGTCRDGHLEVIAIEQEKGNDCVRHGIIRNIDEVSSRINRIIDKLQRKAAVAPRKVISVFIGLSGRSMKSIIANASLTLPDETIIDDQILQKLREQVDHNPIDGSLEVVDAVPCDFMVNNNETKSPKGTIGSYISGTYDLIVCRPQLKRNLQMTVSDKSGLKIEGFIVTALATGQLVLSGEQKRLGCMLADIGAETTSVSIYKDGNLRYYATIPIGSRNITRDITSLSVLEERAEEIKITSGDAIASTPASDLNIGGVRMSDVSNIVVARSEEIVANIIAQIEYSGLKNEDLPSGIVVIGGGSKLKGMIDLLKKQSYMNVERGELPAYVSIGEAKIPTSEIIEVVSVLYAGANTTNANCMQTPKGSELPVNGVADTEIETPQAAKAQNQQKEVKTQKWTKWRDRLSKIFTPQDDEEDTELE